MNSSTEKVSYATPVVLDHGSIADHTFSRSCRWVRDGRRWKYVCTTVPAPGLSSTF